MKTIIILLSLVFSYQAWASNDAAKQLQRATKLHQESCTKCHQTDVYTRKNRTIHSLDALVHKVKQCEVPAQTNWSAEEADWVVKYLNKEFYKF